MASALGGVDRILRAKRRNFVLISVIGPISLLLMLLISLCIGPVSLSPEDVVNALLCGSLGTGVNKTMKTVVVGVRLPRALVAMMVGMALSISDMHIQALVKNPLADPYIMGVASGAALGAALIYVASPPQALFLLPAFAFAGSITAFILSLALARAAGETPMSIILSGMAVSTSMSAAVTIILFVFEDKTHGLLLWLFGTFSLSSWLEVDLIFAALLLGIIHALMRIRQLNALIMGDDFAKQLGVDVKRLRKELLVTASLLTSISVSFSGIIGFIGLISPHLSRLLVGGDHRVLIPAAVVIGAVITMAADLTAKTMIMPAELPVGALTAVVGAPFFIYLLVRSRGRYVL